MWFRGGSFKEIELSRLSLAKPAKVYMTKAGQLTADFTEQFEIPRVSPLSLAARVS
jgi:hypothetical protein